MKMFDPIASALDELSAAGPAEESLELIEKRLRVARALDAGYPSTIMQNYSMLLLRPQWSCTRPEAARRAGTIEECRAEICSQWKQAARIFSWLDARQRACDAYRRLRTRHLPWADAGVAACLRAVQFSRASGVARPHTLIVEGSLGAEAVVAAAAGSRVTVCEPHPFAASAIEAIARHHGVTHAIKVVPTTFEALLDGWDADVLVLTPLLEEAVLGGRLLAAAAKAKARSDCRPGKCRPLLVPRRVGLSSALGDLGAGCTHGVDLSAVDAARWSPYPLPLAVEREEGGTLLSRFERLFEFDLAAPPPLGALHRCEVSFTVDGAREVHRGKPCQCNALVFDVAVHWGAAATDDPGAATDEWEVATGAHASSVSTGRPHSGDAPSRRAVLLMEPFTVHAQERLSLDVAHDGLRVWAHPPKARPSVPPTHWGRVLMQAWHFSMLRDTTRNAAYHAAIDRAAAALAVRQRQERPEMRAPAAIDVGCGTALLSVMTAQALRRHGCVGHVLGVEVLLGVKEIAQQVVEANGEASRVQVVRKDMATLCQQMGSQRAHATPQQRARSMGAPLLVAELMDTSGNGEGLLPLVRDCVRSGVIGPTSRVLPGQLRLWAVLVELRACGTAVDGAELLPSSLAGVDLEPWLAFHRTPTFAGIDIAAAEYAPLTDEFLMHAASIGRDVLGEPPTQLAVPISAAGTLNAILWSWEVDLDEGGGPPLSNHAAAPATHWRQACYLFPRPRKVRASDSVMLSLSAEQSGRLIRIDLLSPTATPPIGTTIPPPRATRTHVRIHHTPPSCSVRPWRAGLGGSGTRVSASVPQRSGDGNHWVQRALLRTEFASRRARMPVPPAPKRADPKWAASKERLFELNDNGLLCASSVADGVAFCEAALEIGAHPAQYGVHPVDAEQAVRYFYSP